MNYVKHKLLKPNAIESRLYQEEILNTAIQKNCLVVLPTGLGKTAVAALVAAHRLDKFQDSQVLFLAPTRPLAAQHKKTFESFFNLPSHDFVVLTGVTTPKKRKLQYDRRMIFATPQAIENDIKNKISSLENFSLLILDEVHRAVGKYSYPCIAQHYRKTASNPLILALTASPGGTREKINEICKNLGIQAVEIRTEKDVGVLPYIQETKTDWVFVNLPDEFRQIQTLFKKILEEKSEKLVSWKLLNAKKFGKRQLLELQARLQSVIKRGESGYAFFALSTVAELMKIEHALELLETQGIGSLHNYLKKLRDDAAQGKSKAVKRIMNDERIKNAMIVTERLFESGFEHPKLDKLKETISNQVKTNKNSKVIVFSNYRNTVNKIVSVLNEIDGCRPVSFVGQASRYEKGLKQKEQIERLEQFETGKFNCLVGTSISEEGLHVPAVDLAVFYEPVPSEIRTIQRRGRVGRTRFGKIIFLITRDTRDEAYYWSAHHKERKMKRILKQMKGKELKFGDEPKGLERWLK